MHRGHLGFWIQFWLGPSLLSLAQLVIHSAKRGLKHVSYLVSLYWYMYLDQPVCVGVLRLHRAGPGPRTGGSRSAVLLPPPWTCWTLNVELSGSAWSAGLYTVYQTDFWIPHCCLWASPCSVPHFWRYTARRHVLPPLEESSSECNAWGMPECLLADSWGFVFWNKHWKRKETGTFQHTHLAAGSSALDLLPFSLLWEGEVGGGGGGGCWMMEPGLPGSWWQLSMKLLTLCCTVF